MRNYHQHGNRAISFRDLIEICCSLSLSSLDFYCASRYFCVFFAKITGKMFAFRSVLSGARSLALMNRTVAVAAQGQQRFLSTVSLRCAGRSNLSQVPASSRFLMNNLSRSSIFLAQKRSMQTQQSEFYDEFCASMWSAWYMVTNWVQSVFNDWLIDCFFLFLIDR